MRRISPQCFCAIRSTRVPCLLHSAARTPQHRSAAAFSRLGDSASTSRRKVASIWGSCGFRSRKSSIGRGALGMARRCYQCLASRAIKQNPLRRKEEAPGLRLLLRSARETAVTSNSAYRREQRFAYNYRFAGDGPDAAGRVRGETESANATGRGCDTEDTAAPLSLSDGGRHPRDGAAEAYCGREKRNDQRVSLSGTFSGSAGHAGSVDYRIHGANRRTLAAHGSSRSRKQTALLRGRRRCAIPPAGGAWRPIESRNERAQLARGLLQAGRQSNSGRKTGGRGHADVQNGGPRPDGQGPRTRELTMREIHPQAVVAASAKLGAGVQIGPYAVVGENVELGDGCLLHAHATVGGPSKFGKNNVFYSFSAIGGDPQDYTFRGERTELVAGDGNIFREYVTVSRGTEKGGGKTSLGDNNFFLAYSHIGHDCSIGSNTLFVNGATLAGHVTVEDFVTIGAFCPVHQFCRIGQYAYIGASTVITQDVPPFSKIATERETKRFAINAIGLERKGFSPERVRALKRAYRLLLRAKLNTSQAVAEMRKSLGDSADVRELIKFIESAERGIVK